MTGNEYWEIVAEFYKLTYGTGTRGYEMPEGQEWPTHLPQIIDTWDIDFRILNENEIVGMTVCGGTVYPFTDQLKQLAKIIMEN